MRRVGMTRSCVGPVSPSMRRNKSSEAAAPIASGILGHDREAWLHEVAQHHLVKSDQRPPFAAAPAREAP